MQTQQLITAHSLYVLYGTLPDETKQLFLQELLTKQTEKIEDSTLYLACKAAREENEFLTDTQAQAIIE